MSEHLFRDFQFRAQPAGDGLTLEGYAAVFDEPTGIRDHLGEYTETIVRGAFRKTLRERVPIVQWDHGNDPTVGTAPIAEVADLREDKRGLFIRARVFDTPRTEDIRRGIEAGAISGMSFRFEVTKDEWDNTNAFRTIREVKLYELGPVAFPAYAKTTVGLRGEEDAPDQPPPAAIVGAGTPVHRDDEPPAQPEPTVSTSRITREDMRQMARLFLGVTDEAAGGSARAA